MRDRLWPGKYSIAMYHTPRSSPVSKVRARSGWVTRWTDLHLPAEPGEEALAGADAMRRQHLERDESARTLIAGQVDLAGSALADWAEHLVRTDEQAAPVAGKEFGGLIARQFTGADKVIGQGAGVGPSFGDSVLERGLQLGVVEQFAAQDRMQELLDAAGRVGAGQRGSRGHACVSTTESGCGLSFIMAIPQPNRQRSW